MWEFKDRKMHASLYTLTRLISPRSTVGFHVGQFEADVSCTGIFSLDLLRRSWIQNPVWCLQIKTFEGRW